MQILYGGSVKDSNFEALMAEEDIDGFLIGGASLKPQFKTIVDGVNKAMCNWKVLPKLWYLFNQIPLNHDCKSLKNNWSIFS